jgi:hypothetical protein
MRKLDDWLKQYTDGAKFEIIPDDGSEESMPPCPNNCIHGWVKARPDQFIPCPSCEEGQANLKMQWERRLRAGELPSNYRDASLSQWLEAMTDDLLKGKVLAYLAACEFAENPQHLIPSHALAQRVRAFMGDDTPSWVGKILSEPNSGRIGFVLQGEVGTGKTWLAAATMNALTALGESVLYMRAQDIIRALTATWKTNESDEGLLTRFKEAPFLFIDDMNLELRGDGLLAHQKDYMESIIRYRSNYRLPTFITCNITLEQFYEQWGSRIADVIAADLQWVKMGGAKLRQSQQQWGEL